MYSQVKNVCMEAVVVGFNIRLEELTKIKKELLIYKVHIPVKTLMLVF